DARGFDVVALSEHHGVDDGYMSAPITLAAAIAGRTRTLQINVAAVLVPLHDPVRLAEQLAVVQLVSGGRLSLVAGMGYRHEELEMGGGGPPPRRPPPRGDHGGARRGGAGGALGMRGGAPRGPPGPAPPP